MKRTLFTLAIALAASQDVWGAERFDHTVRNDFFSGFAGNTEALERAMKVCEVVLAENPRLAEALVWHGAGLFFQSGIAFRGGDQAKGSEMIQRGLAEMDLAVEIAPDSIAVRIPRGSALLTASRRIPVPDLARQLLAKGVADYETVYEIQKSYLDKLGDHPRGELLFGIAEGQHRLGNEAKAREYFEKLLAAGKASGHEAAAKEWMDTKTITGSVKCSGCHVK